MADIILNLLIFLITAALIFSLFRKDGQWTPDNARGAFRFFTVQSNTLCAVVSLITAVTALAGGIPQWAWTLKYIGTAAVTVTMLTVIFFLAPSIGKDWYDALLKGASNLFMHLLTPLMALAFSLKGNVPSPQHGAAPVLLFGPLYLYKIVFAPEEKRPGRTSTASTKTETGRFPFSLLFFSFLLFLGSALRSYITKNRGFSVWAFFIDFPPESAG